MINQNNYEEYMMLLADGELNATLTQELYAFVKGNPALEAELKAYMDTRISSNAQIVMPNKSALLKHTPAIRIGFWPKYKNYAVAAALALLFSIGLYRFNNSNSNKLLTQTNTTQTPPMATVQAPLNSNIPANQPNASQTAQPLKPSPVMGYTIPIVKTPIAPKKSPLPASLISGTNMVKNQTPQIAQVQNLQKTDSSLLEIFHESNDNPPHFGYSIDSIEDATPLNPTAQLAMLNPSTTKPNNILNNLPILKKRSGTIKIMKDIFAGNLKKAKRFKQNLNQTDIVLKLGNKELLAINL